jgi:nucleotide-binding universal stress UspA family protein
MNRNDVPETFDERPHALRMTPAIVVGIDASAMSGAALRWAAAQSRLAGLPLRVVHAWQLNSLGTAMRRPASHAEAVVADARAQATSWVLDALGDNAADLRWTLEIVEGAAGQVLVHRSRSACLLVVGTREHTGLRRLGSVSHYCISHAVPPVVAVPAPDDTPATPGARSDSYASFGPLL